MAGHYYNGRELELLIPASSLEVLKIAVIFGADAVYIGGRKAVCCGVGDGFACFQV